jgi:hypothetical protein
MAFTSWKNREVPADRRSLLPLQRPAIESWCVGHARGAFERNQTRPSAGDLSDEGIGDIFVSADGRQSLSAPASGMDRLGPTAKNARRVVPNWSQAVRNGNPADPAVLGTLRVEFGRDLNRGWRICHVWPRQGIRLVDARLLEL